LTEKENPSAEPEQQPAAETPTGTAPEPQPETAPKAEPATVEAPAATAQADDRGAHDDFDWDEEATAQARYSQDQMDRMADEIDATFREFNDNEIVQGTVMAMTDADVVLNIGFKSDGLVSLSEFRDMENLKVGDQVEVFVVAKEDKKGQLVLSRKSAKLLKAWEAIAEAYKTDNMVTGTIVSKTKGGLIVDVFGLETFLPGSQIDVKPIVDYDAYIGKKMEFKVVKINEAIKNAVVSHKALIESDLEAQRQEIIAKLEKGQVLEGNIKNITDFGAFIDLGGVDGLLYITDISWGRISHPKEVLELNQKLNVVVLDFDDAKKRISLGLKQLTPHPWDVLDENIQPGTQVKGRIVNIEDYGAFLEIIPGVEGLIHISEVSWSNQPINSKEFFNVGEEHDAMVVTIDREERKMSLSLKQLQPDPWLQVEEHYPIGSQHKGLVKNITPYGVFVELDENIGGMVHISDLSWLKRFQHPSEFTKVGEMLDVKILGIDHDGRKISLGHKQIEEDPWDTFAGIFPVGSVHEATVIRREDKGAIVALPYGLEGFVPNRHLKKEDGKTLADVDEVLPFKVIEFDRDDKRIVVSHTRHLRDQDKTGSLDDLDVSDEPAPKKRKTASRSGGSGGGKVSQEQLSAVNRNVEKSTFGELDALAALKAKLEAGESAPAKPAAEADAPAPAKPKKTAKKAEEPAPETPAEPSAEPSAEASDDAPADDAGDATAEGEDKA
jgi:small subunit ribosomal protein S1